MSSKILVYDGRYEFNRSMSPAALFWIAGVIALFPLTTPLVPIINLVGGAVSVLASIGVLVFDSIIPSSYVWYAILIFVISCLPFVRKIGRSISIMLIGRDPEGRDVNLGDALIGSIIAVWYNYGWLDFASNNGGTWLISLNWFLGCIGLWSFLGLVVISKFMVRR